MTLAMIFVLILVLIALILFATEKLPVDLVAMIIMAALLGSGIITPIEGIAGFSNTATVTVGAMFVLSAGLFKTGAINLLGSWITGVAGRSPMMGLLTIMLTVSFISAFINNTAAVAIFMPIVFSVASKTGINASKLLIPLSFASMFGGACSLLGTSTNILVSSIAEEHGEAPFSMFEFLPFGLIICGAGTLYMFVIGIRMIPNRRKGDLTQKFEMSAYLTEIVLGPECDSVGKQLSQAPLIRELDIAVLQIYRNGNLQGFPSHRTVLQGGDVLRVRCSVSKIKQLQERRDITLSSQSVLRIDDLESNNALLVEAVVAPNSALEGKTLKEARFRNTYGAIALALGHLGEVKHEKLSRIRLQAGDVLLISVNADRLKALRQEEAFLFLSEVDLPKFRRKKMLPAFLIVSAVVFCAALGILPIVACAIIGCVLLVITRCLTMEEAYEAVDWRVIFLLAGVLTLGVAMEKTGGAEQVSHLMLRVLGDHGPQVVISALFFVSFMLTNIMSNNATAALLAPIAIVTAHGLNADPRPFLMAVTFAASLSFMTPVGYQTNTMIYGVGQYRFVDFLKVGTPLNLLFWILGTIFIPIIWPP